MDDSDVQSDVQIDQIMNAVADGQQIPDSPLVVDDDLNRQIDDLANDEVVESSQSNSIQSPEDISLYSLIIRQLADDGFTYIANELAMAVGLEIDQAISERKLASIVSSQDQDQEQDEIDGIDTEKEQQDDESNSARYQPSDREDAMNLTVDRESLSTLSRPFPTYTSRFVALHKNAVRAGCFSSDGNYAASASNDFSIKYLDVDKMHHYSQVRGSDDSTSRPVIRTYYDHSGPISQVVFHPVRDFLVSASQDATIKIFDLQRSTVKKSFKHIKENSSVNSIDFHPCGDFLICGTDRPQLYMYDMNTFQRYCTSDQKMFHQGPVIWVQYASQAKYYASCSADGSIKIWDGVNGSCVRTIAHAHSGAPVSNVQFSMNGKYILSGGRDSTSRLWDVSTGKLVFTYEGAVHNQSGRINIKSVFSFNDEFILSGDEMSGNITVWDTRTGALARKMPTHTKSVTWIVSSPVEPAILTCSEDGTAKFWTAD